MLIVCTGSRRFRSDLVAAQRIMERLEAIVAGDTVMEGGADGADRYVRLHCRFLGIPCETVEAKWWLHEGCRCRDRSAGSTCRFAGLRRNREMLARSPGLVIGFWDGVSRGTKDCLDEAERLGILTERVLIQ